MQILYTETTDKTAWYQYINASELVSNKYNLSEDYKYAFRYKTEKNIKTMCITLRAA